MSQGFKINKKGEVIYFSVHSFDERGGTIHGFSTRHGGVSSEPYADLNLGFHTGDVPEAVRENRLRFCNALGIDPVELVTAQQVHGDRVCLVTSELRGAGALDIEGAIPSTDAMITREKNLALMAFFADCVPILIYDPVGKAIGVAHAGWNGTIYQIGSKTIQAMAREFGTKPRNCLIAIGPSIGPCCYEVDALVIERVKQVFPYWQDLAEDKGNGHWNLDLWAANKQSLIKAGVPEDNISLSGMCTKCNGDMLFSYRGEKGITGRLAAVIKLS
ncbi:MAG TPA: peptidoglycan editing factor PgeF [Verrucomicrobiae bacterium]|nr:peptidoglycan editing factor PgeF [Verrucomicrobiae bacterium]